ncbi:MAG: hypothetical protein IJT66_00645, partial [Clostridia bacterium]|nr:hypothetical protein [Clostridia bacterium]
MLQNTLKRMAACLTALIFGFSFLCVSAEPNPNLELSVDELPPTDPMIVSVTNYGADGQDEEDDYYAFRQATEEAMYTDENLIVEIPAGTYYLDNEIPVYSHTTIIAEEGATMIARYSDLTVPLLFGAHMDEYGVRCKGDDCTHGGYSQVQDVTIIGGVWDRGSDTNTATTTVFSFRHAKNITLKNLTVENATDHLINLSGVDTALVENVTVQNHLPYKGKDAAYWGDYQVGDKSRYNAIEAIHLDYCNKIGEDSKRAKPFDNTPSKNITVTDCTFTD